jgi:Tfp pilus assembly protein PilV
MPKAWLRIKNQRGFSVVEALLAAAVFGFLVTGLIGAIVYGRASSAGAGDRGRAMFLAEEGIEATRNIAAASYVNLGDGTYGLVQTGNQWTLSGASDVSGIYTRQVVIAPAGTNRKSVTSTVTWPQPGGTTSSVTLTSRLGNWAVATKLWSNAIAAGSADVTGTVDGLKTDTVGNYAYTVLNATTNNFVVTNISTPTALTNSSTITLAGTPTNIFVSGNYAWECT